MKNKMFFTIAYFLFVFTACLLLPLSGELANAASEKPIKLKWQVAVPSGNMIWDAFASISNRIKELSGGRLEMELIPGGGVVPVFEQLDSTSKGVIDASAQWAVYWTGKHPAAGLFYGASGGPFGMDHFDFLGWMYHGGGRKLYQKFYDDIIKQNVHVIPTCIGVTAQPLGWFAKPIRSVEDMKKLKWRIGGFAAEVWSSIGSSTVMIPGGEILPSGERGIIGGAEWSIPAVDITFGFHDVWKNYVMPGVAEISNNGELLINKDVWNKLPPDLQAIIEAACMEGNLRFITGTFFSNAEALKTLQEKYDVKIWRTPPDVLNGYLEAWDKEVAPKYAEKYPFFKEVLDSQRKWASYVVPGHVFIEPDQMWLTRRYWPNGGVLNYDVNKLIEDSRK